MKYRQKPHHQNTFIDEKIRKLRYNCVRDLRNFQKEHHMIIHIIIFIHFFTSTMGIAMLMNTERFKHTKQMNRSVLIAALIMGIIGLCLHPMGAPVVGKLLCLGMFGYGGLYLVIDRRLGNSRKQLTSSDPKSLEH